MQEKNPGSARRRLVIKGLSVGLMGAATGIALAFLFPGRPQSGPAALTLLPDPRPLEAFQLTDQAGNPFTLDNLRGVWSLIFFGFTNCPDVCPGTLYDLNQVSAQLPGRGDSGEPLHQVIFVSVDPERDTPEALARYVAYFNPAFTGATGPHDQLAVLTGQLGIAYRIAEHEAGADRYDVLHSSSVVLTGPDARLRGAFTAPLDAGQMARDLAMLINRAD